MGPDRRTWKVVGIAWEPLSLPVAYAPLAFFERQGLAGMANGLRLCLEKADRASIRRAKGEIEENLESQGLRIAGISSNADARFGFDQHMLMIYVFLIVTSCVLGAVGGLGLATTMNLNVLERRREMGILRAVGATTRAVWLIVACEGAAIAVSSWAVAALVAWPVSCELANILVELAFKGGLDFAFEPAGPLVWLAVSVLLGIAASMLPAWHASRRPVREALAYE